ncbi:MAG: PAS domain-containing protein, partial [Lentisphaerae bacterium]|nr:PAS domain-containing protein [Lentisphaerota bacterium]
MNKTARSFDETYKALGAHPWLLKIFNNSPDGLVVLDPAGTILAANRSLLRITGKAKADIQGHNFSELIPAARHAQWQHDLEMLKTGKWNVIEGCLTREGHERPVPLEITLLCQCEAEGLPVISLHMRDISIYHNVEKALMASQEEWALSFDAITDCMCILDNEGRVIRANRAMQVRFQPEFGGELTGRHYLELMPPSDKPKHPALPHPVCDAPFVMDCVAFQGLHGWFSARSYPLEEKPGRPTGVVMVLRDITTQMETEAALKNAEAGLRQAAKMEAIGRLAGGIAHD